MRLSNLIFPIIVIGALLLLSLPALLEYQEEAPCIIKQTRWDEEKQTTEHLWKIEGDWYLVKETPHGDMEIVGLYSRFK